MQKFLKELFESFIRKEGREPDNLEMIILKQQAAAKDAESRKIISMFNKEPVDANKKIIGGTNIKETDDEILQRLTQENKDSINRIKLETRKGAVDAGLVDEVVPEINRESMKLVDGKFETTKAPRKFRLNVDTFVRDFPVDKKEAERIATLSSDEQKKIIDKYLIKDTKQRIELMNFEPPKDREPNAIGGRAGYYGGGITNMIEPDLSDIGHGAEAMNSRTRVMTPGSQATTSTGLSYLLGEDNDTTRVPYNEGKMVLPQPKPPADPMVELNRVYNLYTKAGPGVSQETKKYLQQDFIQKLNEAEISQEAFMTNRMQKNFKAEGGRIGYNDGFSVQPFVSASKRNQGFENNTNVDLQDLTYGGNVMYDKGPFSVGIEHLKGKDKYDFKYKDDTIVKDTTDRENTNLLFAIDIANTIKGKARLNKEGGNFEISMPFAEGGPARQGFKMGRRAFLGAMGSVGAGIAGLKAGIFGGGKKAVVKEVAKEVVTGGPPVHFLKLVAKIKSLGDDAPRLAVKDKENVTTYKDYELTENVVTGEQTIQRMKVTDPESASYYGQPLTEETYMSYRPGKSLADETTKGKNIPDEYEEGTAHLRSDGMNAGEIVEESAGVSDEIFEEVGEVIPEVIRKEKADGGRIGYAGGKKVLDEVITKVKDKLGKKSITTADKVEVPKETLLRDMFTKTNERLNLKREMTPNELEEFEMNIGSDQLEAYSFDGTVGDGARILKEQKKYEADMFLEYKKGNLDPVAGDKSPARKRFLEKKLEEAQMSGDNRLITYDEIEELSAFDLGTKMDNAKLSTNDEIKEGVASIMSDTSPAALEKSIEIDNLMLKYPGMNKQLAEQIATSEPIKKADIIAMVEQTFKMSEKGMSGDDIIQTFKNTTRTKQATGGLASIMGQ